ncbi:MAG: threonine synthase, partial [Firmicutes bacterium]|nr:threonine synthase [Bacillota bacterium]
INVYEKYAEATGDGAKTIVAATASPFKFNESVARAILGEEAVKGKDEFALLEVLAANCGMEIPSGLRDLDKKPVLHRSAAAREAMRDAVRKFLF